MPNEAPTDRVRRRHVAVRTALFLVVVVGLLFVFVYPTRTFLAQRKESADARSQLTLLHAENAKLAAEAKRLQRDDVVEGLARQQYGLVKPGETPYVILPAPTTTTVPRHPAAPPSTAKPSP